MVTLINRIAHVHPPVPALTQDDSKLNYCNAKNMPEKCDTGVDEKPVAYCPHVVELRLGKVYEFLMVDDDRMQIYLHHFKLHEIQNLKL